MKNNTVTKSQAVGLYGTQTELAKALRITKSAVSQWKEDSPIPENQALKLIYILRPNDFADGQ
tara:strand:+ start:720 stop:908 length:189 start_codon:yes stop_codon:yes gene_type:complete